MYLMVMEELWRTLPTGEVDEREQSTRRRRDRRVEGVVGEDGTCGDVHLGD